MLFDGTRASVADWRMAGAGTIARASDCTLFTEGGLGMLWHTTPIDHPYSLKLDWKLAGDDNSGVFVGFPDSGTDPNIAINQGYEVQIDATDDPDSTTGAIYNFQAADTAVRDSVLKPPGEWNSYELRVEGKRIRVYLNGTLINDFTSTAPERMVMPSHIGLQNHGNGDDVWFRNVQIKNLDAPQLRDSTTTATADPARVTVGRGSEVTVTVSAQQGAAPTGDVQLKSGDVVLGSGALVDGKVTIPTGAFDSPGTKTLTASYAGDTTTKPSTGSVEITVKPRSGGGNPGGGNPGGGNPGGGNPGGGNPGEGNPAITIRGKGKARKANADRRRRKAVIRVRCSQGANACAGTVRLRVGRRTIGKGRFRIGAGTNGRIRVKLNRRARKLLAQRKRATATLAIAYRDGRTQRVRVRLTR
jgi:hypothetical protein